MAAATLQERLLEDVRALIQGLNLTASSGATGDVGDNVVVQWQRERLNVAAYPAVVVSCEGESEELTSDLSSTEQRGTVYPVLVEVVDQARTDFQAARTDYLAWRHAVVGALHEKTNAATPPVLPNCPECAFVRVRPLKVENKAPAAPAPVTGVLAECDCAEAR